MDYIHVKNLEKYQPGYTDRRHIWAKIYYETFLDEAVQGLIEIDRYRFWSLIVFEVYTQKPVPLTSTNLKIMGWIPKKRAISLSLQMLHTLVEVRNVESKPTVTQIRVEESREEENRIDKEEEYMSIFNIARKKYPSTKRGLSTEYANFVKKHTDWKNILPLLLPAIEQQIIWRAEDGRYWKNFQTWINQSSWEETASNQVQEKKTAGGKQKLLPLLPAKQCSVSDCKMPAVYKDTSGSYDHYACPDHLPAKVKEKYE